jgi:hypothetical protein
MEGTTNLLKPNLQIHEAHNRNRITPIWTQKSNPKQLNLEFTEAHSHKQHNILNKMVNSAHESEVSEPEIESGTKSGR